MKSTNYSQVAAFYDQNRGRRRIHPDEQLLKALEKFSGKLGPDGAGRRPFRVLDLGCGTGNYLDVQMQVCEQMDVDFEIEWYGLDASDAMLEKARQKLSDRGENLDRYEAAVVYLQPGDAQALPYDDNFFDFIACNFAFHHFPDKGLVLDEVSRVLTSSGRFKIWNIQPEYMPHWWVYRFFPAARLEDSERFWSENRLFLELEGRGFSLRLKTTRTLQQRDLEAVLEDARRRDISELANLEDGVYRAGVSAIESMNSSGTVSVVLDEFAQLFCTAFKGDAE